MLLMLLKIERGAWEVVHAYVSLNCVVLFKTRVGRLHQTLRIDLAVILVLSSLLLGSKQ